MGSLHRHFPCKQSIAFSITLTVGLWLTATAAAVWLLLAATAIHARIPVGNANHCCYSYRMHKVRPLLRILIQFKSFVNKTFFSRRDKAFNLNQRF